MFSNEKRGKYYNIAVEGIWGYRNIPCVVKGVKEIASMEWILNEKPFVGLGVLGGKKRRKQTKRLGGK